MTMYVTKLERGPGVLPEIVDGASISPEGAASVLPMGWVLKSAGVQGKNLTVGQKNYLTKVFQVGERTGQKADPTSVSKAMRRVKHSDGSNIFDKCDYLTPLQIAGFFSRLSAKKTYSVEQSSEEEEPERKELITEKAIEEMSNKVMKALALKHPIMYETYNICEIVGQSSLPADVLWGSSVTHSFLPHRRLLNTADFYVHRSVRLLIGLSLIHI